MALQPMQSMSQGASDPISTAEQPQIAGNGKVCGLAAQARPGCVYVSVIHTESGDGGGGTNPLSG